MFAHLDEDIKEIPPLCVLCEMLVHVEYMFQGVRRDVKRLLQSEWYLIYAPLDVFAWLWVESHAPAFEQHNIQGTMDRRPLRLRKAISFTTKETFVEARDAQMTRRRAVYILQ